MLQICNSNVSFYLMTENEKLFDIFFKNIFEISLKKIKT